MGDAIAASGLARDEVFVETKVWISDFGYDQTLRAFDKSAGKLGLAQLDLLILHQALPGDFQRTIGAYRALETLLEDGRVRAIGVSNFMREHLERLLATTTVVPAVNQIEVHPTSANRTSWPQTPSTAYSPRRGHRSVGSRSTATVPAARPSRTRRSRASPAPTDGRRRRSCSAGTCSRDARSSPKSVTPARIAENFDVFDFS